MDFCTFVGSVELVVGEQPHPRPLPDREGSFFLYGRKKCVALPSRGGLGGVLNFSSCINNIHAIEASGGTSVRHCTYLRRLSFAVKK